LYTSFHVIAVAISMV